jgi:Co/Zn/Cd efflux system component
MGISGAVLVAVWAEDLLIETGKILFDLVMDHPVVDHIRAAIETRAESGGTHIVDLHVWRVGKRAYSCALSIVTYDSDLTPERVREQLAAA